MRKYHILIATTVLLLDRISKAVVAANVPLHDSVTVIPGFFRITHVLNRGAAFGLFSESPSQYKIGFLIGFSIIALLVVSTLLWKHTHQMTSTAFALSLIMGGALGNLWDRLFSGHVVDFLEFYLGNYIWPDFNIADSAIVIGALILMAEIIFSPKAQTTAEENTGG
jgi:signal peptidase II